MPADRPGSPDPLARLADVLAEAADGVRPTARELAELLWLARQMEPRGDESGPTPAEPAPTTTDAPRQPPASPREEPPATPPAPDPAPPEPQEPPRVPLHLPSPASSAPGSHTDLLSPAPPMLRHPLGLQRALRPLKRRADAPSGHRLDERATADRIARLGAAPEWWLPVLRPARERWLRLNLVYDTGPTMPVWRPLVRELHTALAQSGIFRTVTPVRADPDGTVHGHGAHAPADGRTVTLVLSDCMGPQWRPGEAGRRWYDTLRRWIRQMPVAVVQPLPEHLWRDTALPAAPGLLSAPHPAAPTAALTFAPYEGHDDAPSGAVPLPVLEPDPRWLANWAALLTSAGGTPYPGSAALLGAPPDPATRTDLSRLAPEDLVLRFRATSSPDAFRLAGHLALGRPDLPVMRLVQRAVAADPRPQHLAEVILSGLLTAVPGPPGSYAFRPGVRDLLLRSLPRSARGRTTELLARVGGLIEERAGSAPGEFRAVTPAPGGAGPAAAEGDAFATVRPESARRLSGQSSAPRGLVPGYRPVRLLPASESVWLAERVADGERVALRLLEPVTEPVRRAAFLRDAARLKELTHPNVVAVHDFGIEGDVPYLAMEYVDGIALKDLAELNSYRLPPPLVAAVGSDLAHAVTALHAAGATHGGIDMSRIMLLPDGTTKLTPLEPGRTSGPTGREEDLRALCGVMLGLTTRSAPLALPIRPETLVRLHQALRPSYAEAFTLLLSRSPTDQDQGAALLTRDELLSRAREAYDQRRYYVLSALRVELPDGTSPEFAPLERAMLALLLLKNGRTVTYDQLRSGLWEPYEEPKDAPSVLERIASRLWHTLGAGELTPVPGGYALHTSADYVDLVHYEELDRRATVLAERGSHQEARECLQEALDLWGDEGPLVNVPGPSARAAGTNLLQLRLDLYRKWAELHMDMGEYERAATYLRMLLGMNPDREDYRRLLLIALRELDRIDDALEVFQEYEWSGGDDPTILALGHELRGEHADYDDPVAGAEEYNADPDDGATSAPGEDPYPTEEPSLLYGPEDSSEERPLPRDEVPESLFAGEDDHPDERLASSRAVASFEYADWPHGPDAHEALGRAVVRLLVASGLDPDLYELWDQGTGYEVRLRLGVSELPLLAVTLQEFTDRVAETGGLRWRVMFHGLADTGSIEGNHEEWRPRELIEDVLDASDAPGIVAVSNALRDELDGSGRPFPVLRTMALSTAEDGWYLLAHPVAADTVPPVQGPFRLPARSPLPLPRGGTRALVYSEHGTGLTLSRPREETFYYEVDLTERSTGLDRIGPPVDGTPVFEAKGTAVWRIKDPVEGVVRKEERQPAPDALTRHLDDCLYTVSSAYPASSLDEARTALNARLDGLSLPGHEIRWTVTLARVRPSPAAADGAASPSEPADPDLVAALRAADAVLFGFDGTLTRLANDTVDLDPRYERQSPDRHSDALDLLRLEQLSDPITPAQEVELRNKEVAAVGDAPSLAYSDLLLRTLDDKRLPLAVVTNCSTEAVVLYLERQELHHRLLGGVHGRSGLSAPLLPDPYRLLEAARQLGVPPGRCLMIGATGPERDAARAAGVRFIDADVDVGPGPGRAAPDAPVLYSAGLLPLLRAARTL
ncbi:SAV_2336 N-terminal domain-related protein [Streptomyces sp. NPDC047085]|uniref:SAV_2336 N-terminal domain-related protein n=1 Tax=Streptomyces sp. NPDC047085 TaxID=3155140 RepID=UPI0033FEC5EE